MQKITLMEKAFNGTQQPILDLFQRQRLSNWQESRKTLHR
jgi:hypothetical protein